MYVVMMSPRSRIAYGARVRVALAANGTTAQSPPIYALLANIQFAHARKAPKVSLPDARMHLTFAHVVFLITATQERIGLPAYGYRRNIIEMLLNFSMPERGLQRKVVWAWVEL